MHSTKAGNGLASRACSEVIMVCSRVWQASDLIHPSSRGHEMIADCLAAFLSPS